MPATDAQIAANRANALKSTGPKTQEGKDASRCNSYKHGMTGKGVILPEAQAAEVERMTTAIVAETKAPGEVGKRLARQFAVMAVRLDTCFTQQTAATNLRVRRAMAEVAIPEGASEEEIAIIRDEAGNDAMFDTSPESILARRYEAAAERHLFRSLQEMRLLKREQAEAEAEAVPGPAFEGQLGSILQVQKEIARLEVDKPRTPPLPPSKVADPYIPGDFLSAAVRVDVPISLGRRR